MPELGNIEWDDFEKIAKDDPVLALSMFHNKVLSVLEKLTPVRQKRKKNSRSKMHRMRRLLWKRLAKVRRAIKTATNIHKLSGLLQKSWDLEAQLSSDYTAVNNIEEDKAVLTIKKNPKAFFSFARSRQRTKAKVGPFLDSNGKPNPDADFAAESLRSQYDSVFATPRPAWSVSDFKEHFDPSEDLDSDASLIDIKFSTADVEKACSQLKSTAAAGPDGVPAILLKTHRKQLSKPIYLLW